jgi:hypothetical protein
MPQPATPPTATVTLERLRSHWAHRSGLCEPVDATMPEVLQRCGWQRTLGGVDAYLGLAARGPAFSTTAVDAALAQGEVFVVPAARSCIYVVPARQRAAALRFGFAQYRKRALKDCEKAGVRAEELQRMVDAAAALVSSKPTTTDNLRDAMPPGVVHSLGAAGKKVGLSTAFPVALRFLEGQGLAVRVPEQGHLCNERYAWVQPATNPLAHVTDDAAELTKTLARHYFAVAAAATLKDFANWAGTSQKDAAAAVEGLDLAPVAVSGRPDPVLVPRAALAALLGPPPAIATPRLLSMVDAVVDLHLPFADWVDPAHHDVHLPGQGYKPTPIRDLNSCWQRTVFDDGRIVGVWEWDADRAAIVTATFQPLPPARRDRLAAECARIGSLIAQLGDARAFGLDTVATVGSRAQWVAKLAQSWSN